MKDDFCALTLSAMDGKPISRSTTARDCDGPRTNTGAKWDDRHTLWVELGTPPTEIEPVTGWLLLKNIEGAVGMQVTALDGSSRPIDNPIPGRRLELGWEFPIGKIAATTYLVRPIR